MGNFMSNRYKSLQIDTNEEESGADLHPFAGNLTETTSATETDLTPLQISEEDVEESSRSLTSALPVEATSETRPNSTPSNPYQHIVKWVSRTSILAQLLQPNNVRDNQQKALFIKQYLKGAGWVTEKIWPALFTLLLMHDVISFYTNPEDRYGNNLVDIFGGIATNELAWSNHLGSDLVEEYNYWLWAGMLAVAPVLSGTLLYLESKIRENRHSSNINSSNINSSNINRGLINKLRNVLRLIHPFDFRDISIDHKAFAFSHSPNTMTSEAVNKAFALGNNSSITDCIHNLDAIAEIAERNPNIDFDECVGGNIFPKIYKNYVKWTLGRSEKYILHPIFWSFTLYLLYTKIRLYEIWIQKIVGSIEYYLAKKDCEEQNKVWMYRAVIDDYDCSICGDWPFVSYKDTLTTQGCSNALFSKSRPADVLIENIHRLVSRSDFDSINLSNQAWPNWMYPNWDSLLTQLEQVPNHTLKLLNLSSPILTPTYYVDAKIQRLAHLLQKISVDKLDLNNRSIGAHQFSDLITGLINTTTTYLDISGNILGDTGIAGVTGLLKQTKLAILKAAYNNLTDYGIAELSANLFNTSINSLDISGNDFGLAGSQAIANLIANHTLFELNISNQQYSVHNFDVLTNGIANSTLQNLTAANNGLTDQHTIGLANILSNSNITRLLLYYNQLSDQAAILLGSAIANSSITELDISANVITDAGLIYFSGMIPASKLTKLNISNNRFTATGFSQLANALSNSTIESIYSANNMLGDMAAINIANVLSNYQSRLQNLDLSGNQLTDTGIKPLLLSLTSSTNCLQQINLANNLITSDIGDIIEAILPQVNLTTLILSNNYLDDKLAQTLATVLPKSTLKKLDLSYNAITDLGGFSIANQLIQNLPNQQNIGNKYLSRDFKRALHYAQKQTNLAELNLDTAQLNDCSARALCRVLPSTNIAMESLNLEHNLIDAQEVDINTCQTSAGSHLQPWGFSSYKKIKTNLRELSERIENIFFKGNSPKEITTIRHEQLYIPNWSTQNQYGQSNAINYVNNYSSNNIANSAASRAEVFVVSLPAASIMLPLLGGLFIICLIYKYITCPIVNNVTKPKKQFLLNDDKNIDTNHLLRPENRMS